MYRSHMLDQAFTSPLQQVEHMLKILRLTAVRIGHDGNTFKPGKLHHPAHLGLMLWLAALLHQAQVIPVHHQDQIGPREIGVLQVTGAQV